MLRFKLDDRRLLKSYAVVAAGVDAAGKARTRAGLAVFFMPIGPYPTFDACVAAQRRDGHTDVEARRICGAMERDAQKAYKVLEKSAKNYTLGVVYEPGIVDTQGDFMEAADIEAAAWDFMARLQSLAKSASVIFKAAAEAGAQGVDIDITEAQELLKGDGLDDQHLQLDESLGTIVESFLAPADFIVGGQAVKKGAWLMGVRWTDEMFGKIQKGERTGLSLYGVSDSVERAVA